MHLVVTFLTPAFLSVSGGDIGYARAAAVETVRSYRGRNQGDCLSVAQIIAFGLATLSSLSLSMEDNLSLSMTLRLRSNATWLNRAAESSRRALHQSQSAEPGPQEYPDAGVLDRHPDPIPPRAPRSPSSPQRKRALPRNSRTAPIGPPTCFWPPSRWPRS